MIIKYYGRAEQATKCIELPVDCIEIQFEEGERSQSEFKIKVNVSRFGATIIDGNDNKIAMVEFDDLCNDYYTSGRKAFICSRRRSE